jgi:competence protein ComEC
MVGISERLAAIRAGYLYVPQPPVGWIVAGYAMFIAIFLLWIRKEKRKVIGLSSLCAVGIGLLTFFAWRSEDVRVDILDVGGGQAVLISGPQFERILIDAGSKSQGRTVVRPFLQSRGVNALDVLIISHGDASHYGGVFELLGSVPIRSLVVADATFRSKGYRQLLDRLDELHISKVAWLAGSTRQVTSGSFRTLWPPKGLELKRADDLGLAFEFKTNFGSCLFSGDSGKDTELMIADAFSSTCALLVQGMHANEESLTESYLGKLTLENIVLNTAEFPLKAYPSPEVQERVKKTGAHIHRTDQVGGIIFRLTRNGTIVNRYLDRKPEGKGPSL